MDILNCRIYIDIEMVFSKASGASSSNFLRATNFAYCVQVLVFNKYYESNLHIFGVTYNSKITSWPLVGNEGMNPPYTNVKVDSLIPY